MKKQVKLAKNIEKDFQKEKHLLNRMNRIIGQMEAAKSQKDVMLLSNELHSIVRLVEGVQRDLALDILHEVKQRLQEKRDRALVIQMNKAIKLLTKRM